MADDASNLGDTVISTGSTPTSSLTCSAVVQPGTAVSFPTLSGGAAGRLSPGHSDLGHKGGWELY